MTSKKQGGFTQAQALLIVVLLGGFAFYWMKSSDQQATLTPQSDPNTQAEEVTTFIRQSLAIKQACDATLIGVAPGEGVLSIRSDTTLGDKPVVESGKKFRTTDVFIKEISFVSRSEEITSGLREAATKPISSFHTGAGVGYLKVVMVNSPDPKELVVTFPVKGFFYDMKIVSSPDETKLDEACWANARALGVSCTEENKDRCTALPIDEDGNGTDFVVDAESGAKVHLAECRYFRNDSPLMECAI